MTRITFALAAFVVACDGTSSEGADAALDAPSDVGTDVTVADASVEVGDAGDASIDAAHEAGDAAAPLWVYHDGAFNWPTSNDYSYSLTSINYADTNGKPISGAADIAIVSQAYGGWQPSAGVPLTQTNWDQHIDGMTKFTFSLKPTKTGQTWSLFFHKVGDVYVYDSNGKGETVDVTSGKYGPANPQPNVWSTYVVPLTEVLTDWSAGGVPGQGPPVLLVDVYKFAIADQTGSTETWYVDDVGFIP